MRIIPSVLVKTAEEFTDQVSSLEGVLPMIQLDIADGKFVPNATWADPEVVADMAGSMDIELHLMVEHPLEEIIRWKDVPQIKKVLFHFEAKDGIDSVLRLIHENEWEASIVLNPDTKVEELEPFASRLQGMMFMGIRPGFQGQKYMPETSARISSVKSLYPNLFVELDGGANEDTLPEILKAGADAICPGSAIFLNERAPEENVKRMEKLINKLTTDSGADNLKQ